MVAVDVARHPAPVVPALHRDRRPAAAGADMPAVTVLLLDPLGNANAFREVVGLDNQHARTYY